MKIIDFEKKGNIVRFYLGEETADWGWTNKNYKYDGGRGLESPSWLKPSDTYYGDDWDDFPYEHNAGRVYGEYIKGYADVVFNFDDVVLEPCDGVIDSDRCKNDMRDKKVPCIIVVPASYLKENNMMSWQVDTFSYALGIEGIKKYYFGDELEATVEFTGGYYE